MYGLGKAILAGSKAFTDQRDLLKERDQREQEMARQALQMALLKDEATRAQQRFDLDQQGDLFKQGHDVSASFNEGAQLPEELVRQFDNSPAAAFFPKDKTLDSTQFAGAAGQMPVAKASPGVDVAGMRRNNLPIDSKAALQANSLQNALLRAQTQAYTTMSGQDRQDTRQDKALENAKDIALIGAASRLGASQQNQPDLDALAEVVKNHPEAMDSLPVTVKAKLMPILAQAGFTEFGKALSDNQVAYIAEQKNARGLLGDLRNLIDQNKASLGPAMGIAGYIPYSESQKLKARLDTVRQRVGKALEGGVLRKEDEEKYKYQLATLFDTPELALYKIDGLMNDFDRDVALRQQELRAAGRRVPNAGAPPAPVAQPKGLVVGADGKVQVQ